MTRGLSCRHRWMGLMSHVVISATLEAPVFTTGSFGFPTSWLKGNSALKLRAKREGSRLS